MLLKRSILPGWKTSNCSLVTTEETKAGSAFAKNGTAATNDRQLQFITSYNKNEKTNILRAGLPQHEQRGLSKAYYDGGLFLGIMNQSKLQ